MADMIALLTAQTAAADGAWVYNGDWIDSALEVDAVSGGDSCQLCVSNAATKPADNTHGVPFGAAITAPAGVIVGCWRWVKVRKTVGGAAATQARLNRGRLIR